MKVCWIVFVTLFLAVCALPRRISRQTTTVEDRRGPGLDDGQAQPPPAPYPVFTNPILNNPNVTIPEKPIPGRPPLLPDVPEVTTALSDRTTKPSFAFVECLRNCPSTTQYNPVCGSDGVTYDNPGRLRCAAKCRKDVRPVRAGTCSPLR